VQTPDGRSDFHALERELKVRGGSDRLIYYAFDLIYMDGFDLRDAALVERKRVLEVLLTAVSGPVKFSGHLEGNGRAVRRRACELELEGIVSKRVDGLYRSGRTDSWVKVTCRHRDTFAIAGWAVRNGRFDGLYLARPRDGELVYAGKLERGL
jgi:bifunctional non-homologous end joining protein LigD